MSKKKDPGSGISYDFRWRRTWLWRSPPVIGTPDLVYKLLPQISFVVLSIAPVGCCADITYSLLRTNFFLYLLKKCILNVMISTGVKVLSKGLSLISDSSPVTLAYLIWRGLHLGDACACLHCHFLKEVYHWPYLYNPSAAFVFCFWLWFILLLLCTADTHWALFYARLCQVLWRGHPIGSSQ